MKRIVLLVGLSAVVAALMSSCYKQTVCATYTMDVEQVEAETNDNF